MEAYGEKIQREYGVSFRLRIGRPLSLGRLLRKTGPSEEAHQLLPGGDLDGLAEAALGPKRFADQYIRGGTDRAREALYSELRHALVFVPRMVL